MGLFDFLKPKKDPTAEISNDTRFLPLVIMGQTQKIQAQCANLKAVGRLQEAKQFATKFLAGVCRDCLNVNHYENDKMITALTDAAILLDEAKFGKAIVEKIIDFHEKIQARGARVPPALDMTQPYIDAGRLAHRMNESLDEEYRCFWLATQANPPPLCKQPATTRQKAIAHNFAYSVCGLKLSSNTSEVEDWEKRKAWHDAKRREFAPTCDWDDMFTMLAWLQSE